MNPIPSQQAGSPPVQSMTAQPQASMMESIMPILQAASIFMPELRPFVAAASILSGTGSGMGTANANPASAQKVEAPPPQQGGFLGSQPPSMGSPGGPSTDMLRNLTAPSPFPGMISQGQEAMGPGAIPQAPPTPPPAAPPPPQGMQYPSGPVAQSPNDQAGNNDLMSQFMRMLGMKSSPGQAV